MGLDEIDLLAAAPDSVKEYIEDFTEKHNSGLADSLAPAPFEYQDDDPYNPKSNQIAALRFAFQEGEEEQPGEHDRAWRFFHNLEAEHPMVRAREWQDLEHRPVLGADGIKRIIPESILANFNVTLRAPPVDGEPSPPLFTTTTPSVMSWLIEELEQIWNKVFTSPQQHRQRNPCSGGCGECGLGNDPGPEYYGPVVPGVDVGWSAEGVAEEDMPTWLKDPRDSAQPHIWEAKVEAMQGKRFPGTVIEMNRAGSILGWRREKGVHANLHYAGKEYDKVSVEHITDQPGILPPLSGEFHDMGNAGHAFVECLERFYALAEGALSGVLPEAHRNQSGISSALEAVLNLPGRVWTGVRAEFGTSPGLHVESDDLPGSYRCKIAMGTTKGGGRLGFLDALLELKLPQGGMIFYRAADLIQYETRPADGWLGVLNLSIDRGVLKYTGTGPIESKGRKRGGGWGGGSDDSAGDDGGGGGPVGKAGPGPLTMLTRKQAREGKEKESREKEGLGRGRVAPPQQQQPKRPRRS